MDEKIAQFTAITTATPEKAEQYLRVSDLDVEQAVQLFFETGGADLDLGSAPAHAPALPPRPQEPSTSSRPITIDDDDLEDADLREAMRASGSNRAGVPEYEDDEAMARRLQEELYGSGGNNEDTGVRAPIPKTRETLVGGMDDDEDEELYSYPPPVTRSRGEGRPGIFSQRTTVWEDPDENGLSSEERRRRLAVATGGASESSSKANSLAEMYRPPFEIMSHLSLEDARDEAKDADKWIIVNVQDQSVFDSQILNRDIWKTPEVKSTIRENFIFLQMNREGKDARDYIRLYIPRAADPNMRSATNNLFPHIAIIDPRTGEQVKVWTEMPKTSMEFVHQLHEFLERYSLRVDAKNPVQRKTKPKVDVEHMTEDEMLQMAMQASLDPGASASAGQDPDALTKDEGDLMDFEDEVTAKGKSVELSPFQKIANDRNHSEPPNGPQCTRIQFKMHDGTRVVRRFLLSDTVERLFEYVKADLLPEQQAKKGEEVSTNKEFELVAMSKRLIDILDQTVEEAGLKMGTIMVETLE
ncbi:hypothetical protein EDC01DRAFT_211300 [Geopyxis carbonaria]|nr:hypothetical protein EDC01DRAFT_211300 [Geopyxis carbonaria]